jgi:hypothetical protein
MGNSTELTIRRVDEVPPEKSGKYRYVVSRAPSPGSAHHRLPLAGEDRGEVF